LSAGAPGGYCAPESTVVDRVPFPPEVLLMLLLAEEAVQVPWGMIWAIFAGFWVLVLTTLFICVPLMTRAKKSGSHH